MSSGMGIKNPEFECSIARDWALNAMVQISSPESGDKLARASSLFFDTSGISGYPMTVFYCKENSQVWEEITDIGNLRICFFGDYEAETLKEFFQHVGMMMLTVYGDVNKAYREG